MDCRRKQPLLRAITPKTPSLRFRRQVPSLAIKMRRQRKPEELQDRRSDIHDRRPIFDELVA